MSYSTPIIPSDLLHKISTIELPSVETIRLVESKANVIVERVSLLARAQRHL